MADEQPNNQRYYDVYADMAEVAQPLSFEDQVAIDAVVAAVRAECWEDCTEAEPCGYCQHGYRRGRQHAARDIRADTDRAEWALNPQEHAARIAEGNTNHG